MKLRNLILTLTAAFCVSTLSNAGLPPTTLKGQSDTTQSTTFNYQTPLNQSTRLGSTTGLIETGNTNLLKNPGFEDTTAGNNWTASGGATTTTTSTTANVGSGTKAYDWDSNSASQTLTSAAITIPAGLFGRNLEASCNFKCASGTCTHTIGFWDGTTLTNTSTITSSSTYARTTINGIAASSGTIAIRITSVSSNEPEVFVDDCYLGEARNLSQVSQAQFSGSLTFAQTTNCAWTVTQTTYAADFSADSDCSTATVTGSVTSPSKTPQVSYSNAPPGTYFVQWSSRLSLSTSANAKCRIIDDLSNVLNEVAFNTVSIDSPFTISGTATYTTAGNRNWKLQCLASSGDVNLNIGLGTGVYQVFRYPGSPEQAVRPDTTPASWSGYHGSDCSWAVTNTSFTAFSADASCTFTELYNRNFGTVTSSGSKTPGITFTPPRIGRYFVCATPTLSAGSTGAVRLFDSTNSIVVLSMEARSAADTMTVSACGIYDVTTLTSKTLEFQGRDNASSMSITGNTTTTRGHIEWSIFELDAPMPAPILVGSVTSNSTGAERIERALIANNGTCTVTSQSGSWVSSLSHPGTGRCVLNYSSIWSSAPACVCTGDNETTSGARTCSISITPTTTSLEAKVYNSGGTATDQPFNIICMGTR